MVAAAKQLDPERAVSHGRSGQVGARPLEEVGVMALRGGDVVGEHTLYLVGEGERIELTHRATDRSIFARGAVRAAQWVVGRPAGLYDMADVMGIPALGASAKPLETNSDTVRSASWIVPNAEPKFPSDDEFCGKCGYARRDHAPERLDQSRIRMHEESDPAAQRRGTHGASSQQRLRKHTVLGMPTAAVVTASWRRPRAASHRLLRRPHLPLLHSTSLTSARPGRARAPQKTMLGIPRPDFSDPAAAAAAGRTD